MLSNLNEQCRSTLAKITITGTQLLSCQPITSRVNATATALVIAAKVMLLLYAYLLRAWHKQALWSARLSLPAWSFSGCGSETAGTYARPAHPVPVCILLLNYCRNELFKTLILFCLESFANLRRILRNCCGFWFCRKETLYYIIEVYSDFRWEFNHALKVFNSFVILLFGTLR